MASVDERISNLVEEHLGITDHTRLSAKSSELGINSLVLVAFLKKVNEEFSISVSPSEAPSFTTLQDFINHVKTLVN